MYKTEANGIEIIYSNECIQYGALEIKYTEMSDIQYLCDKGVFRFVYRGKILEIPCGAEELDTVRAYYQMAAAFSPEEDPIENQSFEQRFEQHSGQCFEEAKTSGTVHGSTGPFSGDTGYSGNTGDTGYSGNSGGFSHYENGYRGFEKNVFTWVFAFLLGGLGVDRFVRGQIGLGLLKLFFGWATLEIWWLVDWIIAMVKAYGSAFGGDSDFIFDYQGRYIR